jgi:hypothetical protein
MANLKLSRRVTVLGLTMVIAAFILAPALALAQPDPAITQRPISDFLSQQGTYCRDHPAKCAGFVANYVGLTGQTSANPDRIVFVDYAALEKDVVAQLGTSTSGNVTERRLPDGTSEVRITLHTRNALTQVRSFSLPQTIGDHWFGYTAIEVKGGATPGVGDSTLEMTLISSTPGATLPDIVRFAPGPEPPTGFDMMRLSFTAQARGPLRTASGISGVTDGTAGHVQVTQRGLIRTAANQGCFDPPNFCNSALADAFPAEHINLQVVGR